MMECRCIFEAGRVRWPILGGVLGAVAVVAMLAAVPRPAKAPPSAAAVTAVVLPSVKDASFLTTNNARLGGNFTATVHAPPGALSVLLFSADDGPTSIYGQPVDLGANWHVLAGPSVIDGNWTSSLSIAIPDDAALDGMVVRLQAGVLDPSSYELAFTNSAVHQISAGGPTGIRVLIVRQTAPTPDAPFAPTAPQQLAQGLAMLGCGVEIVDDALPDDVTLARFDCLLDCRFNVPPSPLEKDKMERFLRTQGGVFLLCGPSATVWGQQRATWVQEFLVNRLGIGVTINPGGNLSGAGPEEVSPLAPASYLNFPYSVSGVSYVVEDEGGNFGVLGSQSAGHPWIVAGPTTTPTVFGMFFDPADVSAMPVRGRLAVLFNGSSETFANVPESPSSAMMMFNACWFLDS